MNGRGSLSVISAEVWKQVPCLFLCQQWATCRFCTVITSQASGLQILCDWPSVQVAGLKLLAVLSFMEKPQPVLRSVNGRLQCLLLYCLRIYRRLWVGECWGEEDSKCGFFRRAENRSRTSEEASHHTRPSAGSVSVLRLLSWSPGWP